MILALDNIKVAFGARPVLKGVSLAVDRGEIYALMGRNGAGKSTTIRAALGLAPVCAGTVRLLGRDPCAQSAVAHSGVGLLSQRNSLPEWMTGQQYISYFASLHRQRLVNSEIRDRLSEVGLEVAGNHKIATYSHTMKQRLGLAQALIAQPSLLIVDQPADDLATHDRHEFHDTLLALAGQGTAILLCTQRPEDIERVSSRVGFIDDGRTVLEGQVADLLAQRSLKLTYRLRLTGTIPAAEADGPSAFKVLAHDRTWTIVEIDPKFSPETVWRELVFRGGPIAEIVRAGGGLDQLYRDLTVAESLYDRRAA